MIKTKRIGNISTRVPKNQAQNLYINVLTWHNEKHANGSKYHVFSPYYLKTDGQEEQKNDGGVLFENFWQGSKVWPIYYDISVWAHTGLRGIEKHLWFRYICSNNLGQEKHFDADTVQPEYFKWRDAVFKCSHPIRYPNGYKRKSHVAFSLLINSDGTEERLSYIEARKKIYVKEYGRLVRKLPEYAELKEKLLNNYTLHICECDVPDNQEITLEKLEEMVNDPKIRFGHGLCLAWELLKDLKDLKNEDEKEEKEEKAEKIKNAM